jgi:hypothetical protein
MNSLNFTGIPTVFAGNLSTGVVDQGRALAWAVEALATTEMNDPFERAVADLLQAACERRLDEIEVAPDWASEEISGPIHVWAAKPYSS